MQVKIRVGLGLLVILLSNMASAGTSAYWAKIDRIVIDDENFGGCTALTVPGPQSTGLQCGINFVSMDCNGDFFTKNDAQAKLTNAQLTMVTGKFARIVVDDSQRHNGLCVMRRIDATNLDAAP